MHTLKDGAGYAYTYRKTLRLSGESLIIEHELKNTGSKPIATTVYDHNFFTLDGKTTGPDNVVRFPFAVKASRPLNGMPPTPSRSTMRYGPSRVSGSSAIVVGWIVSARQRAFAPRRASTCCWSSV